MIAPIVKIDFKDYTELIPAFLTIVLISFTYNIGVGITAGLISYPLLKTITGRHKEVPLALWLLAAMSLSFYIFYPYK
jgi:AGZA family xanthine/uracil permease-like MFS transporter